MQETVARRNSVIVNHCYKEDAPCVTRSMTSLPLRILTAQDLAHDTVLLPAFSLINNSYNERQDLEDGSLPRYPDAEALLQDVGDDSLCAIIQDTSVEAENIPVAVVIVKRWRGRQGESFVDAGRVWRDYEIGPAVTLNLPAYRGRGLISRCISALSSRLLSQVEGPVYLWVKVVEEIYAGYWARRGFEQVGERYVIPVGEWHSKRAYTLVDMRKEVSREGDL